MAQQHLPSSLESATVSRCTFAVSDVTPAAVPLRDVDYHAGIAKFLGGRVEACSRYVGRLVDPFGAHPLIETLHRAFQSHYPVCLSPRCNLVNADAGRRATCEREFGSAATPVRGP